MAISLFMSSCGKEKQQASKSVGNFKRLEQVEDERVLFNLFTAREKADLAIKHLDFCASYYRFTDVQNSVLTEIKSKLISAYALENAEGSEEAGAIELDVNQYFSSLSEEQKMVVFNSMVLDEDGVQKMIANTGASSVSGCDCSSSSSYCSSSWGPTIKCDQAKKCGSSKWGCGTLWLYSCNGKCRLFS